MTLLHTPCRRLGLVAAAVLFWAGCASAPSEGDRYFEARNLAQAEVAYRTYLESASSRGTSEARALFRLGLMHSLQGGGLHDPERARRYFSMLQERYPASGYALQAEVFLGLRQEADEARERLTAASARSDEMGGELDRLRQSSLLSAAGPATEQRMIRELEAQVAALREEVERLAAELAERELELERIKRIDLESPPGGARR